MSTSSENLKRLKNAKIQTPNGEINIEFRPVIIKDDEPDEMKNRLLSGYVCDYDCSYKNICGKLYDPTTEDKSGSLVDLCEKIVNDNTDFANMVPVEGTLENIPGFEDIFNQNLKKDPVFHLSTIIDRLCPMSCPLYDKEHSNCNRSENNYSCILNQLLLSKNDSEDAVDE